MNKASKSTLAKYTPAQVKKKFEAGEFRDVNPDELLDRINDPEWTVKFMTTHDSLVPNQPWNWVSFCGGWMVKNALPELIKSGKKLRSNLSLDFYLQVISVFFTECDSGD